MLSNSNIIFNANFAEFVAYHQNSGADITIMYTADPNMQRDELGCYLAVDESGMVTDMEVDPTRPNLPLTSMEVVVMKRELLRTLVDKGVAHGYHDFNRDVLLRLVTEGTARVNAWAYTGLCWRMDSVQSYFKFNMDMLDTQIRHRLFTAELPVYTKVRDEMPARYGDNVTVVNSLVADGCIIEGTVENSVLARGVRIAPGAHVKNCIIMQDGQVHNDASIENCILDKQTVIKRSARLIGPAAYPIVIAKNVVI